MLLKMHFQVLTCGNNELLSSLCDTAASVQIRHLLPSLTGSSAPLQFAMRGNVLQFPVIQMANCTQPPALNDKWQKKAHFLQRPAYLSAAH